jgi:hypothetical protein
VSDPVAYSSLTPAIITYYSVRSPDYSGRVLCGIQDIGCNIAVRPRGKLKAGGDSHEWLTIKAAEAFTGAHAARSESGYSTLQRREDAMRISTYVSRIGWRIRNQRFSFTLRQRSSLPVLVHIVQTHHYNPGCLGLGLGIYRRR